MKANYLLIVIAGIEVVTGLALLLSPSLPISLLVGASLDTPGGLIVVRVLAAAMLAMGMACWLARNDEQSHAARGVIAAMLLYNGGAGAALIYASIGLGLSAIGLWPAVVLHAALAGWCLACLRTKQEDVRTY
jgi:hypothetical protein